MSDSYSSDSGGDADSNAADGAGDDTGSQMPAGLVSSASAPRPAQVSSAWQESDAKAEAAAAEPTPPPVTASISLSPVEARVLGSMVEKSFLTPDVYPMTTNALVGACNQKTNRDPVVAYSAVDVDATLLELRQRDLVRRVHAQGSRSTKHRQTLDEALALSASELVLMSVLLLRGPQTMGELRTRTDRHQVGFDDLDAIESSLSRLQSRPTPLVRELARQPGQKENRWMHLLFDDDASASSTVPAAPAPAVGAAPAEAAPHSQPAPVSASASAPTASRDELLARVEDLEGQVARLTRQLTSLAAALDEPLD